MYSNLFILCSNFKSFCQPHVIPHWKHSLQWLCCAVRTLHSQGIIMNAIIDQIYTSAIATTLSWKIKLKLTY